MSNKPKPFVFVLMPFSSKFDDIYKLGIKEAAADVGAYAERLDEQIFNEGMLDRIFNQISKADIIVADMTDRNPNVFYEVGYAHALGKKIILLTNKSDDIPFDLKHQQHLVYEGSIVRLKELLTNKLKWAIESSINESKTLNDRTLSLRVFDIEVPSFEANDLPTVIGSAPKGNDYFTLPIYLRNESFKPTSSISHVYLFMESESEIVPAGYHTKESFTVGDNSSKKKEILPYELASFEALPFDSDDGLVKQVRLPINFTEIPMGAIEERAIGFMFKHNISKMKERKFKLRIHTHDQTYNYTFNMAID
ncbi:nucleoside 2-deoxyribosyltransferase [Photobacterium leiognathi]|uniref:nucleoside 2-deoxyribosyltransferase n=1 Tax=Photobacterium leiognathi TaxID=553611 RepID=UPI001EDECD9B|nr:nucleoside 2-deoxyribosyltransferase [Photobacterium leiognathi]MCG3886404.1 nucleoside 2-deoxyribosyltransferase [Photobacterium leiognathi]